jgi:hypothetical protein
MLLVERCPLVRRFLTRLCTAIEFGATAKAAPVLQALLELPGVLDGRGTVRVPTGYLDARQVRLGVVPAGWWRPLVFPFTRPEGSVDRAGYVFCVLEQFHQRLRRRDIFAASSNRWGRCTAPERDGVGDGQGPRERGQDLVHSEWDGAIRLVELAERLASRP